MGNNKRQEKPISFLALITFIAISAVVLPAQAAMNDYCITPPFIQESILPNLLMVVDNSASMYDLAYTDKGKKYCSVTTATDCTAVGDDACPSGETCSGFARQPVYCSDQTFSSANTYVGYFDPAKRYSFNWATEQFVEDTAVFSCTASAAGDTVKSVNGHLCVIYSSSDEVTTFKASGKYLNWLTASKFDVEKEILTGGKYMGKVCSNNSLQTCAADSECGGGTCGVLANPYLLSESRGCVGRSFIKKALTSNFVNYASPETNNPNTPLGITFAVRGPYDNVNPSAPSPGGLTHIDIYKGSLSQAQEIACQKAMDTITSSTATNADIKQDVCGCLTGDSQCKDVSGTQTAVTKTKVSFQQSMQACWACDVSETSPYTCTKTDIGIDDMNTAELQCTDIYNSFATCSNNPNIVCTSATAATDCGAGNTCVYGPSSIVPGNPALFCGNEFMGQYYAYKGPGAAGTCSYDGSACITDTDCIPANYKQCKKTTNNCTTDLDCPGAGNSCSKTVPNTCSTEASTGGWFNINGVKTYPASMYQTHRDFCGAFKAPPVIDPTDSPSDTTKYDNVPAILSGTAIEANLNQPLTGPDNKPLTVRLAMSSPPTGVLSEFSEEVRIGAMTFNYTGSATESASGALPIPKTCSTDPNKTCMADVDCPTQASGTCIATTAGTTNLDGAQIVHYVGTGHCTATTSTVCYNDTHCPSGEKCKSDGVGDHTKGLVKAIDDIRARSWTPFAEAFYDAMGYFSKTSSGTSRTDLRINTSDFNASRNPSLYRCQSNNILLISDGMSTADQNSSVDNLAKAYPAAGGATSWGACPSYAGSVNMDNIAWIGRNRNINTLEVGSDSGVRPVEKNEMITTYVVFNGDSNGQAGECNSKTLMAQTATNGGTTLLQAVDPSKLDEGLRTVLEEVAAGVASGTASSILNNSEGSGAALIQAVFYPSKVFDNETTVSWIGEMQGLWYYLDPQLSKTSIREDTSGKYTLNLRDDRVVQFYFDDSPNKNKTLVNRYADANGDGAADDPTTPIDTVDFEQVLSLWKAGRILWERDLDSSPRTIYTSFGSVAGSTPKRFSNAEAHDFNTDTSTDLWAALQTPDKASATKIIDFIHGKDQTELRNRKVTISGCGLSNCTREWKLGDIITSTPKVVSNININSYHSVAPNGYNDSTYNSFINSSQYRTRGMVFVGGNDGMLHAFKLGILKEMKGVLDKAKIVNPDGTLATASSGLGSESWSFIPKQVFPYLTYLTEPTYTHLYYVDRTPTIVDASITKLNTCTEADYSDCTKTADTWRTILVGGMGLGGASKAPGDSCTNCVKTPVNGIGYSSYFALDVTNPEAPIYLWDFYGRTGALGELGYTTTGPAIVRISAKVKSGGVDTAKPDNNKNGKWFAVFASGPSGTVESIKHEFKGESEMPLRLFILDLATGELLRTITTTIDNAFGGSLATATIDTDRSNSNSNGFYSDDVVYIPFVKKDDDTGMWTKGGILRLQTKESRDPDDWEVSTVIDDIGPITSAVGKLQDRRNSNLWLYVGTGRYYYKLDDTSGTRQKLFGIKEPCYSTANRTMQTAVGGGSFNDIDPNCTDSATGVFVDQTGDATSSPSATIAGNSPGWSITLDASDSISMTEREITDPVAATNGAVFFTTIKPSADVCKFGGDSLVWAVRYDTGGIPPSAAMQGRALMQVSTGAFAEFSLKEAFSNPGNKAYDGRRTSSSYTGLSATGGGLLVVTNPKPVKKMIQIMEK